MLFASTLFGNILRSSLLGHSAFTSERARGRAWCGAQHAPVVDGPRLPSTDLLSEGWEVGDDEARGQVQRSTCSLFEDAIPNIMMALVVLHHNLSTALIWLQESTVQQLPAFPRALVLSTRKWFLLSVVPRHHGVKVLHTSRKMSERPLNSIIWSVSPPCFVRPRPLPHRFRSPWRELWQMRSCRAANSGRRACRPRGQVPNWRRLGVRF